MVKKPVTIPEEDKDLPTLPLDEYVILQTDIAAWPKYDLFRNHWEHDVILIIDNEPKRIKEWIIEGHPDNIESIFAKYGLDLDGFISNDFIKGLKEVITHGNKHVGIKLQNTIRLIP